jgi:hypothetical protein
VGLIWVMTLFAYSARSAVTMVEREVVDGGQTEAGKERAQEACPGGRATREILSRHGLYQRHTPEVLSSLLRGVDHILVEHTRIEHAIWWAKTTSEYLPAGRRQIQVTLHLAKPSLDQLSLFLTTDIQDDPILRRVFNDCDCGHLLDMAKPELRARAEAGAAADLRQFLGIHGEPDLRRLGFGLDSGAGGESARITGTKPLPKGDSK